MSLTEREWKRFSVATEEAAEELWQARSPQRDRELTCFRVEGFFNRLFKLQLSIPPWMIVLFSDQWIKRKGYY